MSTIPKKLSVGEETFALHCRVHNLTPVREFHFDPVRKWRIDFAWPDRKLAVEIESSVHRIKGRFSRDIDKYNALEKSGWTLLRYTAKMVTAGIAINDVLEWLKGNRNEQAKTDRNIEGPGKDVGRMVFDGARCGDAHEVSTVETLQSNLGKQPFRGPVVRV